MAFALELKIPPPVVGLFVGAIMWIVARMAPGGWAALPGQRLVAVCLLVAGVASAALGIASFRRARTTVNPLKPETASALVVSGIYRVTRNPMYLGMLVVLLGWALFLSNGPALLGLPAFILYMNRFQIGPEERVLAAMFGVEFAAYRARVRRWL